MTRLTIGVPAYKNARTLRASVESLLAQSFGDFKLIISDDNSPDETQDVAMDLARLDSRIEYVRQPINLKYQNFGFLLRRAETEFFMWAAGDDHWYPDFANRCIAELDANPSIVLATPLIAFEQEGRQLVFLMRLIRLLARLMPTFVATCLRQGITAECTVCSALALDSAHFQRVRFMPMIGLLCSYPSFRWSCRNS